jgi:hypothetical protein
MMVIVIKRCVALPSHRNEAVNKSRVVDNRQRPAQPEPDEDPAVQIPPVREGQIRPDGKVVRTAARRGPGKGRAR